MSQTRAGSAGEGREEVLVLGVGNPLRGDDGVGVHAIARLAGLSLPAGTALRDGGVLGVDLLEMIRPYSRVILLDALRVQGRTTDREAEAIGHRGSETSGGSPRRGRPRKGPKPGEVVVFRLGHVDLLNPDPRFSLHDLSIGAILRLAGKLGIDLPEITVVGVVPAALGWSTDLSPQARAGLEGMVREVQRLLAEDPGPARPRRAPASKSGRSMEEGPPDEDPQVASNSRHRPGSRLPSVPLPDRALPRADRIRPER